jgi:hypothetical protein
MRVTTCIATVNETNIDEVGEIARQMWARVAQDPMTDVLIKECGLYDDAWSAPRGTMAGNPGTDLSDRSQGSAFITECIRYLVLNSAACGMLVVPSTIDSGLHAAMAQTDVMEHFRTLGISPRHRTSEEITMDPYAPSGMTDRLYALAFGNNPPAQWWPSQATIDERAEVTYQHLEGIGITERGLCIAA